MKKFIAAIALTAIASVSFAQQGVVQDGTLWLDGTFSQLAGVQVSSSDGGLALADFEIAPDVFVPGGKLPFSFADGNIVQNTPERVVLGVLGADKRIDIEGMTATSITYDGGDANASANLTLELGLGNEAPASFPVAPVIPEPATGLMAAFGLVGLLGLRRRR